MEREWETAAGYLTANRAGLARLVRAGLVHRTTEGWRFASPVLRDLLLGRLGEADPPALHTACARAVEEHDQNWRRTERIGSHLFEAGRFEEAAEARRQSIEREKAEKKRREDAARAEQEIDDELAALKARVKRDG